ncbi:MAG: 2Fe-2S iron-sulfur cluster-binding protein [Thermomicrobiales bacterium]
MVTRAETKMVTGKINGLDVTVPAGTTILEAARMANIEVPISAISPSYARGDRAGSVRSKFSANAVG